MKDYIVLDLETPNQYDDSISSIAVIVVKDNKIVDKKYTLINPEATFHPINISITKIRPEDVKDSPTFDKYWDNIKELLINNTIIGQNITFDLSVISKTLTRYDIALPAFRYYCTLRASKRYLNLESYGLEHICKDYLNIQYDAHNALEDTQATYKLYKHLKQYDKNPQNSIKLYSYKPRCKRDYDRTLDVKINYLYGLIQKFKYETSIIPEHVLLIKKWYRKNQITSQQKLLKNLKLKLDYINDRNMLTKTDMKCLLTTINLIQRSPEYKPSQLLLSALKGIIDSMLVYEEIKDNDIEFLNKWLTTVTITDNIISQLNQKLDEYEAENNDEFKTFLQKYSKTLTGHIT